MSVPLRVQIPGAAGPPAPPVAARPAPPAAVAPQHMPNVLIHIHEPDHIGMLRALVADSVRAIVASLFDGNLTPQLERVAHIGRVAPHTDTLALFFLLLNVDAALKQRVLDMDRASMPKLARFLQDLKAELVVAFYADEAQSPAAFVDRCFEAYVVA